MSQSKAKIEAVIVNEGEEFEFAEGDFVLASELIDPQGSTWGLVILRAVQQ